MPASMAPLQEEHQRLLPHVAGLRAAGDAIGSDNNDVLRLVDTAFDFLVHHLIPHATAEDHVLYPEVQRIMGAPEATATMSRDHLEVHQLTETLGELRTRLHAGEVSEELDRELRRVLYGLYTLVRVHFAKEEEVYVPLLEQRLTEGEAAAMFEAMQHEAPQHH